MLTDGSSTIPGPRMPRPLQGAPEMRRRRGITFVPGRGGGVEVVA